MNSPQADTRGNAASGAFAANGLRPAQNNYLLDGIDNNSDTVDFLNGTNFVVLPPVDAIQEFKVQTTNFSAEFGRSGAAVLNATIKSGTNAWHGAGWEFFRNDKLDAADYFERNVASDGTTTTRKGQLNLNQFGVAIGGPVIKNKIFIFGDYEGLRSALRFGAVFEAFLDFGAATFVFVFGLVGVVTGLTVGTTGTSAGWAGGGVVTVGTVTGAVRRAARPGRRDRRSSRRRRRRTASRAG